MGYRRRVENQCASARREKWERQRLSPALAKGCGQGQMWWTPAFRRVSARKKRARSWSGLQLNGKNIKGWSGLQLNERQRNHPPEPPGLLPGQRHLRFGSIPGCTGSALPSPASAFIRKGRNPASGFSLFFIHGPRMRGPPLDQ